MDSRRRRRTAVSTACAAVLLCAATGAPAQMVYRHVNADGQVTFSDRPEVSASPSAAMSPAQGAPPDATQDATPEVAKTRVRRSAISPRRAAMVEASEAERRLGQARVTRQRGIAPLPGEWARGEGLGAVNDRYWRRQEKLRRDVEQALRRFNETRRPVYASR
jgi:hypothetical protein